MLRASPVRQSIITIKEAGEISGAFRVDVPLLLCKNKKKW